MVCYLRCVILGNLCNDSNNVSSFCTYLSHFIKTFIVRRSQNSFDVIAIDYCAHQPNVAMHYTVLHGSLAFQNQHVLIIQWSLSYTSPSCKSSSFVRPTCIVSRRILYMALNGRLFSLVRPSQLYVQIFECRLGRITEIPLYCESYWFGRMDCVCLFIIIIF